jgi:hypothetical protein
MASEISHESEGDFNRSPPGGARWMGYMPRGKEGRLSELVPSLRPGQKYFRNIFYSYFLNTSHLLRKKFQNSVMPMASIFPKTSYKWT